MNIRHYFVDEHGDGVLFNAGGKQIVGTPGCSSHFALGVLDVSDQDGFTRRMEKLRRDILLDPYFHGIPSLRPERGKTAVGFHAKNDLPEIRHLVFKLLAEQELSFQAVIRDKQCLAIDVANRNRQSASYRYHPNRLYDEMIKRLFKNLLHKADGYRICFAQRGTKDRTAALKAALEDARKNFAKQWGINAQTPIEVCCLASTGSSALQATDYFLWALQRVFTRREDRYLRLLWPKVRLVIDADDRRKSATGVYYNAKQPLTADVIKSEPGI